MSKEHELAVLAFNFRGTKDESKRAEIALEYNAIVKELNETGWKWATLPEEELPDSYMTVKQNWLTKEDLARHNRDRT